MVDLKRKIKNSCQQDTKSVTDCLLELENVGIICIGPSSCLRTFYFKEGELDCLEQVFLCQLDQTDYLTGEIYPKLEKVAKQAVKLPNIKGVVLFAGCSDYIIQTDYEAMITELEATFSIPFFQIWRGPIAKCQHNSKEEIKEIAELLASKSPVILSEKQSNKTRLPVLASDISGVASLIETWDCFTFLYTPGSCTESFYDASTLQWQPHFYHTQFTDIDLSLGGTEDIIKEITNVYDGKKEICLLGTPLNHFVHGDYEELESLLREKEIPCLSFVTEGFEEAPIGISNALLKAGKYYLHNELRDKKAIKKQINLIGYTSLTFGNSLNMKQLTDLFKELGYSLNVITGNLKQTLESALCAQVNWVVSDEGLALAKWLEEEFEIPYIKDLPIGLIGLSECLKQLSVFCNSDLLVNLKKKEEQDKLLIDRSVLLLGEPSVNEGLERYLRVNEGVAKVTKKTYLPTDNLNYFYNYQISGFSEVEELLEDNLRYDVIIGDAVFQAICQENHPESLFIPLAYGVLSGSVKEGQSLVGDCARNWLEEYLK